MTIGVWFAALSPGADAFPARFLNSSVTPSPVLFVTYESEKPHGNAFEAGNAKPSTPTAKSPVAHGKKPGLPAKKPREPIAGKSIAGKSIAGKSADNKKSNAQKPLSRSERDNKLCRALQACRNEFVRCKSKIKAPDQSEEWSVAKEICGDYYKTCVAKDFKGGEWFFTRWFYFKELNCK
jgi:hypothetical protein